MTLSRIKAPYAVAAALATLAGGFVVGAESRYEQPYTQVPTVDYGQQSYQPTSPYSSYSSQQLPAYTPPVQPQTSPYQASGASVQPGAAMQVAQQQPLVQTQTPFTPAATSTYQLPNYQAPAPGSRVAMMQDDSAADLGEAVPAPQSVPPPAPTGADEALSPSNWQDYVQAPTGYGCETGNCNTGECCDYGGFGGPSGHTLCNTNCGRQWFFGVYGLYMTRDNPSYEKFAVLVDSPAAYPYYPSQSETILSTNNIQPDWQWGAEIRLGSTLGQPCGCNGGGMRPYAWEVVYWGLTEDDQQAIVTDGWADTDRIYSQINYTGLQYDRDGAAGGTYGNRPLNDYADYDMPINDPAVDTNNVRILGVRARNYFTAQNLELNFIRFPLAGCNTCDPCCPPRFTLNGICGMRYLNLDETLQYATMFTTVDGGGIPNGGEPTTFTGFRPDANNWFHDIDVDNNLFGFQFGSNMNWLLGSRWSAFCDTQMGIYGNRITSLQRVWGGGEVTWVGSTNEVRVRSRKTDVSFLGELRAGLGYQISCNCRLTAAYRVIGVTGVALAGEQIPGNWSSSEYVGIIDSNDSLVLHGIQWGAEWLY